MTLFGLDLDTVITVGKAVFAILGIIATILPLFS